LYEGIVQLADGSPLGLGHHYGEVPAQKLCFTVAIDIAIGLVYLHKIALGIGDAEG
jgi:hypothetical protein